MNFNKRTVVLLGMCVLLSFCNNVHLHIYDTPGEVWPARVEIKVGDSVNIYCHMNLTAFENQCTVKDLYFMDTTTQRVVRDVAIFNETTIVYALANATKHQTTYRCKCHNAAIGETKVFVGWSPQVVTDFKCRSFDFMKMQCNFTIPDNPVICKYNLSFHFDVENYKYYPKCDYEKSPSSLVVCDVETMSSIYRANEEIYHYDLYSENTLGNQTQRFDINNTKIMVPAKPGQDFRTVQITDHSAMFSFRMPKYEWSYRSKGLQWELILKPSNLSEYIISNAVRPLLRVRNEFSLNLLNLKYAYYDYQLRLRVRLHGADEWSEWFVYKFRTAPRRPDRPPRIDVGGFYTDPSETTVHLYWELLQPYEFNGYNFSYVIEHKNGETNITDCNSVSFPWHKSIQYELKLRSRNHLGLSESFSYIRIPVMLPAIKSKTHTTPAVHNIYHETNGTFTLTWEAPEDMNELEDYTVFWCRSKRVLLNGCEGSIHFQHVAADVHKFTTAPQEHTLNLAVSANYKDFNTGMHWTECTMNEETDLVKMEPQVEAISATAIKIQWTSEKICPSIIAGYNLSFCEVVEPETPLADNDKNDDNEDVDYASGVQYNCREIGNTNKQYKIIHKNLNRFELTDLKPYTLYKIEMFMYSTRKVGKTSDSEVVRTFEAAPSHPRQLNVSFITNTSASLSWLPPREPNGRVRSYTVVLNNEQREVPADIYDPYGRISYHLNDLNSSTSYKVYILAHTISSSQPSNDIHFTTLVGYPKPPRALSVRDSNTEAKLEWAKSNERTDYYEVAITVMENDEIIKRRISVVIGLNDCVYNIPHCFDRNYCTTVDVRAVNAALLTHEVNENDDDYGTLAAYASEEQYYEGNDDLSCVGRVGTTEMQTKSMLERQRELHKRFKDTNIYRLYKSEWQRAALYRCSSGALGMFFVYSASAVLMAVGVFVLLFLVRRKYKKMANIHCTLPAGLDAYISKDFNGTNGNTFPHDFLSVIKSEITSNARIAQDNEPMATIVQRNDCHNEERRLLETTSQDSISLNEQTQHKQEKSPTTTATDHKNLSKVSISSNPMFDSNFDLTFTTQDAQTESVNVNAANYIEANNFATTHVAATNPDFPVLPTIGYIKPNALTNWQNVVPQQPSTTTQLGGGGGYVTVESIDANPQSALSKPTLPNALQEFSMPNNNGYIQANFLENTKNNFQNTNDSPIMNETALQAPLAHATTTATGDSYTTLEQLGKMSAAFPNTNIWNRDSIHSLTQDLGIPIVAPPSNVTPGISGYVTPRELTAFGQQHQNQQHHFN